MPNSADLLDANVWLAYLSAHTYSAPVSFMRTDDHGIDFEEPSNFQYGLAAYGLDIAANSIASSSKRMLEVFPDIVEAGHAWLEAVKRVR